MKELKGHKFNLHSTKTHPSLDDTHIIPFGFHKGKELRYVPLRYLSQLIELWEKDKGRAIYPDSYKDRIRQYYKSKKEQT
jgi:hypothetical protein